VDWGTAATLVAGCAVGAVYNQIKLARLRKDTFSNGEKEALRESINRIDDRLMELQKSLYIEADARRRAVNRIEADIRQLRAPLSDEPI